MSRLGGLTTAAILALSISCAPPGGAGGTAGEQTSGAVRRPATVSRPPARTVVTTTPATEVAAVTGSTVKGTSTVRDLRSFTMAFTGDLLLHNRVTATAAANAAGDDFREYNYESLLEPLRPLISQVDWAVCHMEVNLSADNTRLRPFPVFRSPGDIAHDIRRIGYDSCSTASNHILDHGPAGVTETLGVLDDAGLGHSGAARSAQEADNGIWLDVGDVKVAHLSYTYSFNGFAVPRDMPWLSNLIDETEILTAAGKAREQGAEYVVLSLHWGDQYRQTPNRQQRDMGARLLQSADIDVIIGHHAHVVQPIDRIDGKWLVYGLGNLLADYSQADRRDELMVRITVSEEADGTFSTELEAIPLYLDPVTLTVHRSDPDHRPADIDPRLAAQLDASWTRVSSVLQEGTGQAVLGH